ncbi:MAG TPA: ECF transporter S component [Actinopolymorphaceae bacterium]|jgi:energy-coupling factor transport system substrate-specific component
MSAMGRNHRVIEIKPRSAAVLALASVLGVLAFGWPFLADASSAAGEHTRDAPYLFVVLVALAVAVVAAQLADGGLDVKAVAILGVLAAVGAGLQALSPAVGGFDAVFFLVVLAGRVYGPGFGFSLGVVSLLAGALIVGGIGPWVPFQMIGLGWVGLFAGCLPRLSGWAERAMLAAYACVTGLVYGALLNLWFWPVADFLPRGMSFVPEASPFANLGHYATFYVTTSLGWDAGRAILNLLLVLVAGRPLLAALRRAARRAHFVPAYQ